MAGGPLEGISVVDLTSAVVGPLATQIMADYGAEVIKVEAPGAALMRHLAGASRSGGMSAKCLHLNRHHRSLVLDLKKSGATQALKALIAKADVLIWNMRPPAMRRLGLSYDKVRHINPRIIYCGMYGFGQDGRYREKPAYDSIIQGASGIAALNYMATGEPRYLPMVIADRSVGLTAVQLIMMALFHRERTGLGQSVELPMFENMAKAVLEEHMYLHTFDPPLGDMGDPRLIDPESRPLRTKDGWICISANTDAQAFAIFDAIGRTELKSDPRFSSVGQRFKNTSEYFRIRAEGLRRRTTAEWIEIFDQTDVPAMPFKTLPELMEDPHLQDVQLLERVYHPTEGGIWRMTLPNKLSLGARTDFRHAPKLGEHSVEILREAGLSETDIAAMLESGATLDGAATRAS